MNGSRWRLGIAAVALAIVCASPLAAQNPSSPAPDDTAQVRGAVAFRALTAFLGWIPAAVVGGAVGNALPRGPCYCDDPGLTQALTGAAVGGAVGAAFGAAVPKLNSRCSTARRFGLGLLGSFIGTGIGMIPLTEGAQIITVPLFSSTGAALAEWRC